MGHAAWILWEEKTHTLGKTEQGNLIFLHVPQNRVQVKTQIAYSVILYLLFSEHAHLQTTKSTEVKITDKTKPWHLTNLCSQLAQQNKFGTTLVLDSGLRRLKPLMLLFWNTVENVYARMLVQLSQQRKITQERTKLLQCNSQLSPLVPSGLGDTDMHAKNSENRKPSRPTFATIRETPMSPGVGVCFIYQQNITEAPLLKLSSCVLQTSCIILSDLSISTF